MDFLSSLTFKALYKQLKGSKGIMGGLPKIAHVDEPTSSNFQVWVVPILSFLWVFLLKGICIYIKGTTPSRKGPMLLVPLLSYAKAIESSKRSQCCTFACLKTLGLWNCANSQQLGGLVPSFSFIFFSHKIFPESVLHKPIFCFFIQIISIVCHK